MFNPLTTAQVSFNLQTEIGAEGKNSRTFLARDHQLDADIVIKRIEKSSIAHRDTYFEESRKLYASAHPHVVQLFYACEDDDHIFVAMPHYGNGSLKAQIGRRHLTVREIVNYGCQIAAGLHNIHSKSLIHFDIKVDNVLLSDRFDALIADFGLATAQDAFGQARPDQIYSPITPPEAFSRTSFDRTFDIYQFGLALYVMCNGVDCLNVQMAKFQDAAGNFDSAVFVAAVEDGAFPDRKAFLPHIPQKLRKVVRGCLEVAPNDRYPSALNVANDLASIEGECLDWQYSVNGTDRLWSRNVDGIAHVLTVVVSGKSELTKSVKGGKPKRQSAGSVEKLTDAAITVLLGKT